MNIDELTIAQARKAVEDGKAIEAALGLGSKAPHHQQQNRTALA